MLKGLYTSALGLAAVNKQQEVSANNLSNVNTVGYKKEAVMLRSFPSMLIKRLHDPAVRGDKPPVVGTLSMGVQLSDIVTDYGKGNVRDTGNPSHLALLGEGYFTVNTPRGERYTRNGDFKLSPDGILVTADGYPVLGMNGEIAVKNGDFTVDQWGGIFSGGREIDRLRIVVFDRPIIKEGSSLFSGEEPRETATPQVAQGFLEDSNADAISEMVNMINIMRAYEANQKVIQTQDATLDKTVNEIGRL